MIRSQRLAGRLHWKDHVRLSVCARLLILALVFSTLFCHAPNAAFGFWSQGHHAIAVLAFEMLDAEDQAELIRILKHHPRFEKDFAVPESIQGDVEATQRWWIGVAGEWPDLIRGNDSFDRPTWHYQLGASVVIGDVKVPADPGPLPKDATLETRQLYIVQAIELCKKVLGDTTQSDVDRAIAICWLAHLVADAHQPCHAGSLYSPVAFPDGDRGANSIPVKGQGQIRNLHAFWDSLLGSKATPQSVSQRVMELRDVEWSDVIGNLDSESPTASSGTLVKSGAQQRTGIKSILASDSAMPHDWVIEGRRIAALMIYSAPLRAQVLATERGLVKEIQPLVLTDVDVDRCRAIASSRGRQAAERLAVNYAGLSKGAGSPEVSVE